MFDNTCDQKKYTHSVSSIYINQDITGMLEWVWEYDFYFWHKVSPAFLQSALVALDCMKLYGVFETTLKEDPFMNLQNCLDA